MSVTICSIDFKHTISNIQDSKISGTTTNIRNNNLLIFVCIDSICQTGRCRFINYSHHIQSCNLTSILHSLPLTVIIVCRTSDNCIFYFFSKIIFSSLLHLPENHSGQFFWGIKFPIDIYPDCVIWTLHHLILCSLHFIQHIIIFLTHEPLYEGHCLFWKHHCLPSGRLTNLDFIFSE